MLLTASSLHYSHPKNMIIAQASNASPRSTSRSLAAVPVADPVVPLVVGFAVAVVALTVAVALLTAASKPLSYLSPLSV